MGAIWEIVKDEVSGKKRYKNFRTGEVKKSKPEGLSSKKK